MNDRARFTAWLSDFEPDEPVGNPLDTCHCPLAKFYDAPISEEFMAAQGWIRGVDWQHRFIDASLHAYDSGRRMMPELDQLTAREALEIMENL